MTENNSPQKRTFWTRIKRYLLTGILVTAPAFISLYTILALVNIADRWVKSLIPSRFYPDVKVLGVPGIGLALLLILLIVVGFLTASWIGKKCVGFADRFLTNTPVLSGLYTTLKQLFHTFLGDNTTAFRRVVLVEFPRKECWSIGLVILPGCRSWFESAFNHSAGFWRSETSPSSQDPERTRHIEVSTVPDSP